MPIPTPDPYPPVDPPFDPEEAPEGEWDTLMQALSGPNAGVWYEIRWHLIPPGRPAVKSQRVTTAPEG